MTETTPPLPYRLGLPAWAFPGWRGRWFARSEAPLSSYAKVFNAVEANTSFYATPTPQTVHAWREQMSGTDLRLCFKLPRDVTHERVSSGRSLRQFLNAIEPLEAHLGPLLVQFPARVGPEALGSIERLIARLPRAWPAVIEVRHPGFFGPLDRFEALLAQRGIGWVILDARPLYTGDSNHPDVLDAQHEKPNLPVHTTVYNNLAFVRLILHPDLEHNAPWLDEWADRAAQWIASGVDLWMLIHCPNNLYCPELASRYHEALCAVNGSIHALAPWPEPQQLSLF